jgi:hypothetical protein
VAILDISKTMAPRKKQTADLDSWKSLTKRKYLDNGTALGNVRAIWWPFWITQKLWILEKNRLQIWTHGKALLKADIWIMVPHLGTLEPYGGHLGYLKNNGS